jgi:uncharacterized protein GlcG (DUF336 family)
LIIGVGVFVATAPAAPAQILTTHRIPAALAAEAVSEAVAVCAKQGYAVTATVIDIDARRIAMVRGDGAGPHTEEVSWGKAYTAVSYAPIYQLDGSGAAAERQQPPGVPPFQPPEHMVLRAGGLTIKLNNEVIGAIGVTGAPGAKFDEACVRAGLDRIRDRLR